MSLLDSFSSLLTPELLSSVASQAGVSTASAQSGLVAGAGALLSSIATKSDQPGFISTLMGFIKSPANAVGTITSGATDPAAVAAGSGSPMGDLSGNFVSHVLGSQASKVTDAIASSTGITSSQSSNLLAMAAPLVLGVLGSHVASLGLTGTDLASKLKGELPSLAGVLPAGLGSSFSSLSSGVSSGVSNVSSMAASAPAAIKSGLPGWLVPAALLALLILGAFWYFNSNMTPVANTVANVTATAGAAASTVTAAASSAVSALGDFFKFKLPNGIELNIPKFGIENKLIGFITDSSKPVDKTSWFNFDRLLFATNSATLEPSSKEQLDNIVAILKAYPNVHAKIGGYTDNTGGAAANLKLSGDRAKNVMDAIVASGIDASRLESKGYGEQFPVGDNATEAGRAQNRRISMLVTKK